MAEPPLQALRAFIAESRIALPDELPPMAAGVFGYLGYDMVRLIEELPAQAPDPIGIPDAMLVRPTLVIAFDAVKDTITVVSPVRPHAGLSAKAALTRAAERLSAVVDALDRPLDKSAADVDLGPLDVTPRSNTTPAEFKAMVLRAKEYIAAGDIFQVVLSQRFEAPFKLPPFALYRALRRVNPSPYLFFLEFGGFAIAGSSPELMVKARDGTVTIRPIAGTRPRGATPHEDQALETELLADPKERAEHLMLLDLGRNDVGRVAEIGSVTRHRPVLHRALQPGDAHRLQCRGQAAPRPRRARCVGRGLSRRHGVGRAKSARHADHRRTGEGEALALCRLRRLFLRRRRHGHLHRTAHRA